MSEYIDKQALLKKYCKEQRKGDCKRCDWYGDTWCRGKLYGVQIADFQTADVVPVRHGKWTKTEDDWNCLTTITCSECHEEWCFETEEDVELLNYRYCPNCGAEMPGGEDNGA